MSSQPNPDGCLDFIYKTFAFLAIIWALWNIESRLMSIQWSLERIERIEQRR